MTTDALKALFALLESEEDDFATLVRRFGIDPATDLQNCDLTNVDFGTLTADTLNLTGSLIDGANLSNVRCKQIVGAEDAATPSPAKFSKKSSKPVLSLPLFDAAVLAVSRYQNAEGITDRLVQSYNASTAPVMVFYDTIAEQDFLTKQLCSVFTVHDPKHLLFNRPTFLWFYSRASKPEVELRASSIERNFFELLQSDKTSDDIGVYPYLSNRAAVTRIRESLEGNSCDRMRKVFANQLSRELSRELNLHLSPETEEKRGGLALFSGYPPISKRLYQNLRSVSSQRLKLIFLCSSKLEKVYEDSATEWRRLVVPADPIGRPNVAYNDLGRLAKRIETVSHGTILMGSAFLDHLADHLIGKPLAALKNEVTDRLRQVSENLMSTKLTINEIIL
jgi:hypothetical protein